MFIFYCLMANRQSTEKHNTYQLLYIYSIPPAGGLQICPKHVEVDWRNKLRINSASSWFSLQTDGSYSFLYTISIAAIWTNGIKKIIFILGSENRKHFQIQLMWRNEYRQLCLLRQNHWKEQTFSFSYYAVVGSVSDFRRILLHGTTVKMIWPFIW